MRFLDDSTWFDYLREMGNSSIRASPYGCLPRWNCKLEFSSKRLKRSLFRSHYSSSREVPSY